MYILRPSYICMKIEFKKICIYKLLSLLCFLFPFFIEELFNIFNHDLSALTYEKHKQRYKLSLLLAQLSYKYVRLYKYIDEHT